MLTRLGKLLGFSESAYKKRPIEYLESAISLSATFVSAAFVIKGMLDLWFLLLVPIVFILAWFVIYK